MSAEGTSIHDTLPGLRSLNPQSMASRLAARDFRGLPPGVTRCDLMRAIEAGGRGCGFSRTEIRRLVYLVRHTREIDWRDEKALPVVWKGVDAMAEDLGIGRRQVNSIERSLAGKGAITHKDSASRRRWGERDPGTGRVTRAYGVDLRPLARLYGEFAAAARAAEDERRSKRAVREDSFSLRCEIRQLAVALERESGLEKRLLPLNTSLAALVDERDRLQAMRDVLLAEFPSAGSSHVASCGEEADHVASSPPSECSGESADKSGEAAVSGCGGGSFLPPERDLTVPTIQLHTESRVPEGNRPVRSEGGAAPASEASIGEPNCPVGDNGPGRNKVDPNVDFGVQHVSPARVAAAASGRWREVSGDDPGRRDNMWAADVLRLELGIHDKAWHLALRVLGIRATVVLVAIIDGRCQDRATLIHNPSGFVVGCVKRAQAGDLHLHRSIWGLEARKRWREAWWPYAGEGAAAGAAP